MGTQIIHLRGADPVPARLIDVRPDFDPRAWLARLVSRCLPIWLSGRSPVPTCSTEIAPRRVRAQPPADRASWDGRLGGGTH